MAASVGRASGHEAGAGFGRGTFSTLLQQLVNFNEAQEQEIFRLRREVAARTSHPAEDPTDSEEVPFERLKLDEVKVGGARDSRGSYGSWSRALDEFGDAKSPGDVKQLSLRDCWRANLQRGTRLVEEKRDEAVRVARKHHASIYMEETAGDRKGYKCILRPNDPIRVTWDLLGMFLLFYDICTIPLAAFDPDPHWFTTTMDWTTQIFWTCDIVMSLITGYVHEGGIIVDPVKILKNYLRTWFVLDLAVCGPDWISTFVEIYSTDFTNDPGGVNRLLRSLRVVRTVRLLRLVKLKRILATIKDRITSEAVFILLNICKLIGLLLLVNHFIAAAWYLVGSIVWSTNWLDVYSMRKEQAGLGYRYSTSLHWSLTQFTPASMDVHPQNVWERYFAIMVLIAGLVLFSSFISSITGSMSQLRNMKADKSKQFWLLRRYLKQQKVPRDLCFRVLRYIEYAMNNVDDRVPEGRITILNSLTEQLRNELKFFTHFRDLISHPLFGHIRRLSEAILNRMSGRVLRETELAAGDKLFSLVDASTEMFFIQQGHIQYTLSRRSETPWKEDSHRKTLQSFQSFQTIEMPDQTLVLDKDDYLCEVSLWSHWVHLGLAQAVTEATIISVQAHAFGDLVIKDADLGELVTLYAQRYVDQQAELDWIEVSSEAAKEFTRSFFLGPAVT